MYNKCLVKNICGGTNNNPTIRPIEPRASNIVNGPEKGHVT